VSAVAPLEYRAHHALPRSVQFRQIPRLSVEQQRIAVARERAPLASVTTPEHIHPPEARGDVYTGNEVSGGEYFIFDPWFVRTLPHSATVHLSREAGDDLLPRRDP
jgi:hypothetical protein